LVLDALGGVAILEGDFPAAHSLLVESLTIMRDTELSDRRDICLPLGRLAALAEAQGRMERAARLHGVIATFLARDAESEARPADNFAPRRARDLARVRESLGRAAFEAAFDEGRAMAWEQAVAYAIEDAA
jgi:hypothetical protein